MKLHTREAARSICEGAVASRSARVEHAEVEIVDRTLYHSSIQAVILHPLEQQEIPNQDILHFTVASRSDTDSGTLDNMKNLVPRSADAVVVR